MLKKTITSIDFDGEERTRDYYFNISETELTQMELSEHGGFERRLNRIVAAKDGPAIMEVFRDLIHRSYGEVSDDGRRFIKRRNGISLADEFEETEAYNILFMELCTDSDKAAAFVKAIMPKKLQNESSIPAPHNA